MHHFSLKVIHGQSFQTHTHTWPTLAKHIRDVRPMVEANMRHSITWVQVPRNVISPHPTPPFPRSITWEQVPKDVIALPHPAPNLENSGRKSQERHVKNVVKWTLLPHPTLKRHIRGEKCTKNRSSHLISVKRNMVFSRRPGHQQTRWSWWQNEVNSSWMWISYEWWV